MTFAFIDSHRFGGAAFSPSDVTGLYAWWDAGDESSISSSSGQVDQWNDKSGNAHHVTNTGAARPATGVTTRNSLNVIDFASSSAEQLTYASKSAFNAFHDGTDHHNWIVLNLTGPNDNLIAVMGTTAISTSQRGFWFGSEDRNSQSSNERARHWMGKAVGGQQVINNVGSDNSLPFSTWQIVHIKGDPDNGTAADRSEISIDGGTAIKNNTQTPTPSASNHTHDLHIGGVASANNMDGSIAEILMYDQAVSGDDITSIETYLSDRWNITI